MSFSFGASTATPAAGGFGAPVAAKPAGGGFSFGAPAAAPAATAAPSTGFSFGQPAATKPALSFGAPAATATAAPASTGFSFGTATATSSTGFSLGGTAAPTASTAPTLGGFGTTPAASTTAPTLGGLGGSTSLSFGAPKSTATTGFGLGAPTASVAPSTGLSFGQPAASTATTGGLGGGLGSFGATSSSGAPATLNFGTATTTSTGLAGGLGGSTSTALPASIGLGGSTTAQAPALGLGGAANGLAAGADSKNGAAKTLKEQQVPQPLQDAVEAFKKHVKEERAVSSDIAHISSKVHQKIQSETEGLGNLVKGLASGLAKNKAQLDCLKMEAAQELLNIEIAQRTKDTPPALQYENVAPFDYFSRLLVNFENQMLAYRRQIEETEQHLQSMASESHSLSAEDVTLAIQKQHATFTSLASKYQRFHEEVQNQKDIFLQLHRHKHGASSDLFHSKEKASRKEPRVPTTIGPSPFTGQQDILAMAKASLSARPQQQSLPAPPTFSLSSSQGFPTLNPGTTSTTGFGTGLGTTQPSLGAFGATPNSTSTGLFGTTQSPFGPTFGKYDTGFGGNKRGKH